MLLLLNYILIVFEILNANRVKCLDVIDNRFDVVYKIDNLVKHKDII